MCGKEIKVIPAKIKEYKNHFCSKKCKHEFHIGKYAQEKNPNWRGGYIKNRGNFNTVKSLFFKQKQFCAICGTFKYIHIHHIIPYRYTKDNSKNNLIPLCRKHHREFETLTWNIIKTYEEKNYENFRSIAFIIQNIIRTKQIQTFNILKKIEAELKLEQLTGKKALGLDDKTKEE